MAGPTHFRAHARFRVELGATLSGSAGSARQVRVCDLGLGGAGVELAGEGAPLAVDAVVTLAVRAPTLWDPLALPGRVAWLEAEAPGRPARAGIRFELGRGDVGKLYSLFQLLGGRAFDG
jgi:hypothetical protein